MKTVESKKKTAAIPTGLPADDLERYIARRKTRDARLSGTFEYGYQTFLIGALLQAER